MHSRAAVASGDIKQYYDYVSVLSICMWLVRNKCNLKDVGAFAAVQSLPAIALSIAGKTYTHRYRGKTLLTGTRLAGHCARCEASEFSRSMSAGTATFIRGRCKE